MRRSEKLLVSAIPDIDWEFSQLVEVAVEMRAADTEVLAGRPSPVSAVQYVAFLESGLLHVRSLVDFLDTAKEADITASDYFGEPWNPPKTEPLKRLRGARKILDKHLSHLSWDRVTMRAENNDENPAWSVPALADDVLCVFIDFMNALKAKIPKFGDLFDVSIAYGSMKLRDEWPSSVPEPASGSPLRAYVRTVRVKPFPTS